tara:strand:+ start:7517 stop:8050 length:534 start_codon:yes stop_codon:yes gene_type:complete
LSKRNKRLGAALLALTGAVVAAPTAGAASVSGAVGATGQGEMTWRASLSHDWDKRWWEGDKGYLSGYWDSAYTYWEGGDEASGAHSLSFSPVLVYQFHGQRFQPFVEFGIGVALFSKTDVGERDMGSAFHFEDRLGAGVVLPGGSRLGVRAIHYSNAGIKQPNDGIESYALFYSQVF